MPIESPRTIDNYLKACIADIGKVVGRSMNDKCWPLFESMTSLPEGDDAICLSQAINLKLAPQFIHEACSYQPMTFQKKADRDDFLTALGLREKIEDEMFFPLRETLTSGRRPRCGLYFTSTEMNLAVRLKDEGFDRMTLLLRDKESKVYADCFTSPGGMGDHTPHSGSVSELNEELALVFKDKGRYIMMYFAQEGECGISRTEKDKLTPRALQRMKATYGGDFLHLTPSDIGVWWVPLTPNPKMAEHEMEVTIAANIQGTDYKTSCNRTVLYTPEINAITFYANTLLPFDRLEHGVNLFAADVESEFYNREVFFLTLPEILYARYPLGRGTPEPPSQGNRIYGAVQNSIATLLGSELNRFPGPPAPTIVQWTQKGYKPRRFTRNTTSEGGPYILEPALRSPSLQASPTPRPA